MVFKTPKLVLKWSTSVVVRFFENSGAWNSSKFSPKKTSPYGNGRLSRSFFYIHLIIIFQISWLFHAFHAKPWLPGDRFQRISGQVWFLLYANGSWPARATVTGGQACGQALWHVKTLIQSFAWSLRLTGGSNWWYWYLIHVYTVYCIYIYNYIYYKYIYIVDDHIYICIHDLGISLQSESLVVLVFQTNPNHQSIVCPQISEPLWGATYTAIVSLSISQYCAPCGRWFGLVLCTTAEAGEAANIRHLGVKQLSQKCQR